MDPMQMTEEARAVGAQKEQVMSDAFEKGAPTGKFSVSALNATVGAFNRLLTAMGQPGDYPEFSGDTTKLPGDFVRGLAMATDAAAEMGVELPPVGEVKNDAGLARLAGAMDALSKDEQFKAMMASSPDDLPTEEEAPEGEDDTDSLMMERA
jgi:hypothetical protein